jgi:4-alpha-glucanotransferase
VSGSSLRRCAGVLIPLFSCPSTASWGIGDIGDVAPVTAWLAGAGHRVLQLLPLNEMASGATSPYSATSAMAIDPIFIRTTDVPEFAAIGGETALSPADRESLEIARRSPRVEYRLIRGLKDAVLAAAFERFHEQEWGRGTARAAALGNYVEQQAWWLDDYALFRAIHRREQARRWLQWPDPLRRHDTEAIEQARQELAAQVQYYQYVQWLADSQWQAARASAAAHGVELYGDLPFMVDGDSADVWGRQDQFFADVSIGAPPDSFSETGQDWGLPAFRWDKVEADDFNWLRARSRRTGDLYDGFRIDHVVGFYRTYARPRDNRAPFFTPGDEAAQLRLGERVLSVFRESGVPVIAEDLGTVPDFVRASLARLGVPGFRVFRWERHWRVEGQPFREPTEYPPVSVAASGTHDTEPMATWWERALPEERLQVNDLVTIQRITRGEGLHTARYEPGVRDVLLETLFASGSDLLLTVLHDVFGWRDRINEPGTVTDTNWTFRLPWPSDRLHEVPEALERQAALRTWASRHGRLR